MSGDADGRFYNSVGKCCCELNLVLTLVRYYGVSLLAKEPTNSSDLSTGSSFLSDYPLGCGWVLGLMSAGTVLGCIDEGHKKRRKAFFNTAN